MDQVNRNIGAVHRTFLQSQHGIWPIKPCKSHVVFLLQANSYGPIVWALTNLKYGPLSFRWCTMVFEWVYKDFELGAHTREP